MDVGILLSDDFDLPLERIKRLLAEKGYELTAVAGARAEAGFTTALQWLKTSAQAIIVCGNVRRFFDSIRNAYMVDENKRVFTIEDISYALCETYDDAFVRETVIPLLNARSRTFYTTVRFKTFGKSEEELRTLLKDQIHNRNRIVFNFYPSLCECTVTLRYSNKMTKQTVDEMVGVVAERLKDITYNFEDMTLAETVVDLLKIRGKKLCVAESFTGGAIASKLIEVPGASSVVYEGIVCYDSRSKVRRLGVDDGIITHYGAVSIETVYEMAAGLLMQGNCDLALATTGNAGPTAEKEGDEGHCFISVGDGSGIHIYEYRFSGSRTETIERGAMHALFMLYKRLKQNQFEELLQERGEKLS